MPGHQAAGKIPSSWFYKNRKRRRWNGDTTDTRARATPARDLRFAARSQATPGTRLVFPQLLRGYFRRLHAYRAAWYGKRRVGDDGAQLLGTGLRVPEPRTSARRPILRDQRGILRGLGPRKG